MEKTHWKKLINPDYLGAYSLQPNEELILTIESVTVQMVTGPDNRKEECTIAKFVEPVKPMILNVTNCKTIAKIHKSPYVQDWSGKQIQVFATLVKAFGEEVEALRVRNTIPVNQLAEIEELFMRFKEDPRIEQAQRDRIADIILNKQQNNYPKTLKFLQSLCTT